MTNNINQSQAKASETTGHGNSAGHGVKPDAGRLADGRTSAGTTTEVVTAGETASSSVEIISTRSTRIGGVTVNFTVGRIR